MPESSSPVPSSPRRTDVEGLRALAILLVVVYHAGVPGFAGGYVGVDVFFVVSGYLITSLLVREAEETGKVDLWGFYARRARRLLPAMAVVLAACLALGALLYAPVEQRALSSASLASAAYLSNVFFASTATDYLGAAAETHPLLHTWSLSVEEQFYLVWPVFVMAALGVVRKGGRPSRRRLIGWMAAAAAVSFAASVVLMRTHQPLAFFLSPPRAWEFAAGALAVLLPPLGRRAWPGGTAALGWLGLAGVVAGAVLFDENTRFPGFAALLPVLSTVLVLRAAAARPDSAPARVLGARPLQEIGRLSYSWYLWHWPVLVFAGQLLESPGLPARLALLALSLAIAEASYRLVENPVRHAPWLDRRRSLAMAAAVTVLGVGISLGWRAASRHWSTLPGQERLAEVRGDLPTIYATGCHADLEDTDVDAERCDTGPEGARRTMVLFGDSHAAQWYPALAEIARRGGWRLVSFTKSACPAVDVVTENRQLGREYHECHRWREAVLREVREMRPDLVVMASSKGYGYSGAKWARGTDRILRSLTASSGSVAILRDTPQPGFDVAACVARGEWGLGTLLDRPCDAELDPRARRPMFNALRRAASSYPNAYVVDMVPHVCPGTPCRMERGGVLVFRDADHLTAEFAATLAPALAELLKLGAPPAVAWAREARRAEARSRSAPARPGNRRTIVPGRRGEHAHEPMPVRVPEAAERDIEHHGAGKES
jgi:peptidoglycan/LPS O-acetylase OafA/YrhL